MVIGHFDSLSKTHEKKVLQGNFLNFFLLDTPKITFWMKNSTQRWTLSGALFSESVHFFRFSRKGRGGFTLPPSCKPVHVAEYTIISVNIPKYPWKCLNNLFWLCQSPEYAWSFYMFNRLLKMPQAVNVAGLWIWQDCARIMQESEYSSMCLYNAWTCLILLHYA